MSTKCVDHLCFTDGKCPDCGLDYVVVEDESGMLQLKELTIEGEDWGE